MVELVINPSFSYNVTIKWEPQLSQEKNNGRSLLQIDSRLYIMFNCPDQCYCALHLKSALLIFVKILDIVYRIYID